MALGCGCKFNQLGDIEAERGWCSAAAVRHGELRRDGQRHHHDHNLAACRDCCSFHHGINCVSHTPPTTHTVGSYMYQYGRTVVGSYDESRQLYHSCSV